MDILFQIVVPQVPEFEGLVENKFFEIDGVNYPIEPASLSWRNIQLFFDETTPSLVNYLPANYLGDDWEWLKVSDKSLDAYERAITSKSTNLEGEAFEEFLRLLLVGFDKWVLAFINHYDQIDNAYQVGIDGAVSKIRENLTKRSRREGFLLYK